VCGIGGVEVSGNVVVIGHVDSGCCITLSFITEVVQLVLHEPLMSSTRIILLDGQAESVHRLRIPMVNGPIGCCSYKETSTS
jgi:hypothetical protein